jgi:hypothetical protein
MAQRLRRTIDKWRRHGRRRRSGVCGRLDSVGGKTAASTWRLYCLPRIKHHGGIDGRLEPAWRRKTAANIDSALALPSAAASARSGGGVRLVKGQSKRTRSENVVDREHIENWRRRGGGGGGGGVAAAKSGDGGARGIRRSARAGGIVYQPAAGLLHLACRWRILAAARRRYHRGGRLARYHSALLKTTGRMPWQQRGQYRASLATNIENRAATSASMSRWTDEMVGA